jgi:hypothetical protein
MKSIVIKSNQGNHTGYNRKWYNIEECETIKEAKKVLKSLAYDLSDNIVERNGAPYDKNSDEFIYSNNMKNFNYDGVNYWIITKEDLYMFDGGSFGHMPSFISEYFNK